MEARPSATDDAMQCSIRVFIEDVYAKGDNTFGIVATTVSDGSGAVVQQQRTTFIERSTS